MNIVDVYPVLGIVRCHSPDEIGKGGFGFRVTCRTVLAEYAAIEAEHDDSACGATLHQRQKLFADAFDEIVLPANEACKPFLVTIGNGRFRLQSEVANDDIDDAQLGRRQFGQAGGNVRRIQVGDRAVNPTNGLEVSFDTAVRRIYGKHFRTMLDQRAHDCFTDSARRAGDDSSQSKKA